MTSASDQSFGFWACRIRLNNAAAARARTRDMERIVALLHTIAWR